MTKPLLITALTANTQSGAATATGPAVQAATADLIAFVGLTRRVIDVSTDGFGNIGISETTAALNAVVAGINQVNVLCIGGSANCAFNAGAGSFTTSASFATFQSTLTAKLQREINATVPESVSMAILGTGLLGLGLARRRRAS